MSTDTKKKINRQLRLTDKHPTMVKFMKVYDLMDELGLSISFHGHRTTVEDRDRDPNLPHLYLEDIESQDSPMNEFPPATEFCLIYDNPEYLAEQKRLLDERRKSEAQAKLIKDNLEKERKLAEQAEAAARKEREERAVLAKLKNKYPDG